MLTINHQELALREGTEAANEIQLYRTFHTAAARGIVRLSQSIFEECLLKEYIQYNSFFASCRLICLQT